jgi:hypothetical protein
MGTNEREIARDPKCESQDPKPTANHTPVRHSLGDGGNHAKSFAARMRAEEMIYSRRMRLPSTTPQPADFNVGSTYSALVSASFT